MDISKITDQLYVSSKLQVEDMQELSERNIDLAICMIVGQPPPDFSNHACRILWLQTCDSILIPIPMKALMLGVQAALPLIQSGQSVLVYCAKGRHRSVAMAAAILISTGYATREVIKLLSSQRIAADPQAWHISRRIHKFEKNWQSRVSQPTRHNHDIEEIYAEITTALAADLLHNLSELGLWVSGRSHRRQAGSNM